MAKRYRIIEFVYMVDEDEPEEVLNDTMDAVARVICPHEDADHNCPLVVASARTLTGEEFDRETDRDLLLIFYPIECFVPATADEAKVTIEVPVAWAQYRSGELTLDQCCNIESLDDVVDDACTVALARAGMLSG